MSSPVGSRPLISAIERKQSAVSLLSSSVGSRPARLVNGPRVSVLQVSGAGPLVNALGLLVNVLRRIAAGGVVVEDVVGLEGVLVGVGAGG